MDHYDYVLNPDEEKILHKAIALDKKGRYKQSNKILLPLAEKGSTLAQYHLGLSLYRKADYINAAKWFQIAADKDCLEAFFYLAVLYKVGAGLEYNPEKALDIAKYLSDYAFKKKSVDALMISLEIRDICRDIDEGNIDTSYYR